MWEACNRCGENSVRRLTGRKLRCRLRPGQIFGAKVPGTAFPGGIAGRAVREHDWWRQQQRHQFIVTPMPGNNRFEYRSPICSPGQPRAAIAFAIFDHQRALSVPIILDEKSRLALVQPAPCTADRLRNYCGLFGHRSVTPKDIKVAKPNRVENVKTAALTNCLIAVEFGIAHLRRPFGTQRHLLGGLQRHYPDARCRH